MSEENVPTDEAVEVAEAAEAKAAEVTEAAEAKLEEAATELVEAEEAFEAAADGASSELADAAAPVEAEVAVEEFAAEVTDEAAEVVAEVEQTIEAPVAEPAPEPAPAPAEEKKPRRKPKPAAEKKPAAKASSLGQGAWIGIACAALVLGLLLGRFVLGGGSAGASGSFAGKLSVAESDLDSAMATYTFNGSTASVTAREVILQNSTLEAAQDADGNYVLPSADTVLSVVRNRIIQSEAESRGLTVSDEELAAYAEETLGTSDYASIASTYSMDEDAVVELLTSSAIMSKLRDDVIGDTTVAAMPDAPTTPATTTELVYNEETGEEEEVEVDASATPTKEYADYIIALAGDEWDSAAGTWAATDGPYASALSGYEITANSATYEAAQSAYYVAYQLYSESQSAVSTQWSDFVNGLLSNSTITISTLIA